jgi:DNA-binding LacI/PurR family transcriptional regulator
MGLFIPSDLELAMLMPQLQMMDLRFGGDAHVIGCDHEIRCFNGLDPLPATMDLHLENIAVRAVRRLIYRIQHPSEPLVRIGVAPTIVTPGQVLCSQDGMEFDYSAVHRKMDE